MPRRPDDGPDETFPGADYTDDEREFIMAMDEFKRRKRRPFPTWRDVLGVARSLGYRKPDERSEP